MKGIYEFLKNLVKDYKGFPAIERVTLVEDYFEKYGIQHITQDIDIARDIFDRIVQKGGLQIVSDTSSEDESSATGSQKSNQSSKQSSKSKSKNVQVQK